MIQPKSIDNILKVWKTKNNIENPNIQENVIEVVDQIATLFSTGLYYYFIFNFDTLKFEVIKGNIEKVLGIPPDKLDLEFFFNNLHPEDLEKYHEKEKVGFDFLINHIPTEDIPLYKVVYLLRLKHTNGTYRTILHQSKTINVSKDGRVQHIFCVHTDLTHLNTPMDHNISFISDSRPSYYAVETNPPYVFKESQFKSLFTPRELEIIDKLSLGHNNPQIADQLYISEHTIKTHKRNILRKSGCKNTPQLITRCIRKGLI